MKSILQKAIFSLAVLLCLFSANSVAQSMTGAWKLEKGSQIELVVLVDNYFSHTKYDRENKLFVSTRGGNAQLEGNKLTVVWQYDTDLSKNALEPNTWLGTETSFYVAPLGSIQTVESNVSGQNEQWDFVDQSATDLTGVWRMAGRKQGAEVSNQPLRDRRTLKILTGNRFQWVAINIKTGEFSGTGGGTYTFQNGQYTEHIEFFSRDGNRVGASLGFEAKVIDGQWHHSGNSSKGDPIYEIWGKLR